MTILFLDAVGSPFYGGMTTPLGGSELAQIQLAEALSARGHKVHVVNRWQGECEWDGVKYGGQLDSRDVTTCILSRMTPRPPLRRDTRVIVSLTDCGPHDIAECDYLVGVSRWQVNRFAALQPEAKRRVIPPIVETMPGWQLVAKTPGRYLYAGAAMKGLDATLDSWETDERPGTLVVCHGGWGESSPEQQARMAALGVTYLGNLSPARIREEIAASSYFLGARTYPETFCATAVIAEASGVTPILFSPLARTGLDEAINTPVYYDRNRWLEAIWNPPTCAKANNYSADYVARKWEKLL